MKDAEFIELLNLYLDHEISTADAARLEAEVHTNAARRQIYQQYCRIQKACRMAAADFQTESVPVAATMERKVLAFDPAAADVASSRRQRSSGLYTLGTIAALAACAAVVFVSRSQQQTNVHPDSAATMPVAAAPASTITNPDATFVVNQTAAPRGLVSVAPRSQPMWVRDPLLLTGTTQAEAVRAAAVNQANAQLAWIHAVQLAPLQDRASDDLHFAATLQSEGRALGNRTTAPAKQGDAAEEMVTFQFVK
jgi:hypothetical protein